jgi:hypothetical protein
MTNKSLARKIFEEVLLIKWIVTITWRVQVRHSAFPMTDTPYTFVKGLAEMPLGRGDAVDTVIHLANRELANRRIYTGETK